MLLQEWHEGPQLSNISRQLDAIKAQLDTPSTHTTPHLPQKQSYAAALALGVQHTGPDTGPRPHPLQPYPAKQYDITLTQKSHDKPVFADISNYELVVTILDTLQSASCEYDSRSCSPDSCGNVVETWYTPGIKAAG